MREKMAFSEESWKKSVTLRRQAALQHPDHPMIPFFPTDFLKFPYTIWDFIPPTWNCPHDTQRVGRFGDGGKWVCGMSLYEAYPAPEFSSTGAVIKSSSGKPLAQAPIQDSANEGLVMYSFGINEESSFEAEMLERVPSLRIWGYDFSVNGWGPQIASAYRHRTFFQKVGLGKEDSHGTNPPFWTLPSLMRQNNHTYIDILKIDIEGSEYDALDVMMDAFDTSLESTLPIGQIMIELHLGDGINLQSTAGGAHMDFGRFTNWWARLESMGMRPVQMELNLFAVTLDDSKSDPRCTEYVLVNAKDERNKLWMV